MTTLYSQPGPGRPRPSLRVSASAGIDDAARSVVLAHRTDAGPRVLEEAIRAAVREDAALRVVQFAHDMTAGPASDPAALRRIKELSRHLIDAGLEFEIQRASDAVADQVLELAEDRVAGLIVLSLRRRSPVMKLFLGSSAQRILQEAPCPVLTVR